MKWNNSTKFAKFVGNFLVVKQWLQKARSPGENASLKNYDFARFPGMKLIFLPGPDTFPSSNVMHTFVASGRQGCWTSADPLNWLRYICGKRTDYANPNGSLTAELVWAHFLRMRCCRVNAHYAAHYLIVNSLLSVYQ